MLSRAIREAGNDALVPVEAERTCWQQRLLPVLDSPQFLT